MIIIIITATAAHDFFPLYVLSPHDLRFIENSY
jgi:hypothetical protein